MRSFWSLLQIYFQDLPSEKVYYMKNRDAKGSNLLNIWQLYSLPWYYGAALKSREPDVCYIESQESEQWYVEGGLREGR